MKQSLRDEEVRLLRQDIALRDEELRLLRQSLRAAVRTLEVLASGQKDIMARKDELEKLKPEEVANSLQALTQVKADVATLLENLEHMSRAQRNSIVEELSQTLIAPPLDQPSRSALVSQACDLPDAATRTQ